MKINYESDYYAQRSEFVPAILRQKEFSELDRETEIISQRAEEQLLGSVRLILNHLLKWNHLPLNRSLSWQIILERERNNIQLYLENSPSLKKYLCRESIDRVYLKARLDAAAETSLDFPRECPYDLLDILGNFESSRLE